MFAIHSKISIIKKNQCKLPETAVSADDIITGDKLVHLKERRKMTMCAGQSP